MHDTVSDPQRMASVGYGGQCGFRHLVIAGSRNILTLQLTAGGRGGGALQGERPPWQSTAAPLATPPEHHREMYGEQDPGAADRSAAWRRTDSLPLPPPPSGVPSFLEASRERPFLKIFITCCVIWCTTCGQLMR